ncbi:MAG: 3D-(3,5/4)-trihydroxycyclohexane-1,2-dione acylhydrolase (decyclizing) [Epulopiscium sp. Nele67-Bin001]|nr:MAG: 3D-(3,5/4)-trihydroxycyclohexane-1,2-dione acylhydrolase (decyclizing) [Epulopiscium sp. Nuni2H_MBin001]OON90320.1 MAG: 3D-(3,5/4)-trihydroxycyclohexane-1,2-dione acylhydrolase (decyclizing) [Epulopiscium sp. Nele67-Bin001]
MENTVRLTVAQALVKFLTKQYINVDGEQSRFVHGVMGIFGHGNVVGLGQALEQYQDEITYIAGKNEQEIAHACTGYAKQNNRRAIYAATASIGPGALNMVTSAGTATVNRIPLLLLPGDAYADRQPDPVLQQMENESDYTLSVNDAFKAVSRYWDRIVRPEQLMAAMLNAMRVLTDPEKTGAVTICLPQDVQGEAYDYPQSFFEERVWYLDRRPASKAAINRATDVIKNAKKPMVLSGGGVRYSGAGAALMKFCQNHNIPVAETQAGKGEIPYTFDGYLGCAGVCGTQCANEIMHDADVIITIGTKLNDFVTNSKYSFSKGAQVVSINVSQFDAMKLNAHSIVADATEAIVSLDDALGDYQAEWGSKVKEAKDKWEELRREFANIELPDGFSQTRAVMELNNLLTENETIVVASGSLPSDVERLWEVKRPGQYHLEYGFSCMVYEFGAALGTKLAEPDREVYALVGDGVFLMGHSEFVTSIQERKKVNVILFDNHGHQCIHNLQRSQGCDTFGTVFRHREADGKLSGDYIKIDYVKIAEGYGANAFRATNPAELKLAIEEARRSEVSTVIVVDVLPGTMTEGYENFWRVGVAEVSQKQAIQQAYESQEEALKEIRKY